MTDRASADGLRRYRAIINANGAMEFIEDPDGALVTYADVAALRDTGPRPEPIATLSLYEQGRRQTLMDLGFDIDGIDTATAVEAARGLREALQRLVEEVSNPFDPDNEPPSLADARAALRDTGPRPDSDPWPDLDGPWRDDQGYWLGGMGTPDTGPRPDSDAVLLANAILGGSSYLPHREAAERILARDTGPRPDSGIDALVAAVFAFMDERVDEPHEMTPAEERLMKASREYARLSTPKTSEQKPAGWSTGEPWNPDGAQP